MLAEKEIGRIDIEKKIKVKQKSMFVHIDLTKVEVYFNITTIYVKKKVKTFVNIAETRVNIEKNN